MTTTLTLPAWQVAWVRDTVAARYGLFFGGAHETYLCRQVAARLQEMHITFAEYAGLLEASAADAGELQTLLERLCIHETSFLRDPTHFEVLARYIVPQLVHDATGSGRRRLRVVSAGCSTGQEAYSVAMVLEESRPLLGDLPVEIIGLDVSGDAIERAARGIYPEHEVATLSAWRRERYFQRLGEAYEVTSLLRRTVRWLRWNLTSGLPVTHVDVIFCRNVLLYFQEAQRDLVVHHLVNALCFGGFLVAGYADSLLPYRDILDPIHANGTLTFRRAARQPAVETAGACAPVGVGVAPVPGAPSQ